MKSFNLTNFIFYEFKNVDLFRQAVTSKAYFNENIANFEGNRDPLAAIGDPILNLVVVEHLYRITQQSKKGNLSKIKDSYISNLNLAELMRSIMKEELLTESELFPYTSKGEQIKGDRFLGETLEAIIGAIYLDGGFEAARKIADFIFFSAEY